MIPYFEFAIHLSLPAPKTIVRTRIRLCQNNMQPAFVVAGNIPRNSPTKVNACHTYEKGVSTRGSGGKKMTRKFFEVQIVVRSHFARGGPVTFQCNGTIMPGRLAATWPNAMIAAGNIS